MKRAFLTTTILAWTVVAAQSQTVAPNIESATIQPGLGSATDCQGHVWTIDDNTKILEDGMPVVGGGDTAQLTMQGCTVWGLSNGQNGSSTNWFTMGSADPTSADGWTASVTPPTGAAEGAGVASGPSPLPVAPLAPVMPTNVLTPVTAGTCGVAAATSGAFHVANGQIIGPDGKPFIARGINAADNDIGDADQMIALFPGVNFIRLAIYKYQDPGAYTVFINTMTARRTVVEIEHHVETNGATGGGGQGEIASGAWLAEEDAFYAAVAAAYKSNPYVWFGTTNEPPNGAGLSQWQKATYDAIRGTGNNNPIMMEIMGWPGEWNNMMDASIYAQMTNVIWDTHYYGWVSGYSTDQATVDKTLSDIISQVQQTKSADGIMPALIGEWGPSTDGSKLDPNSDQVIEAVVSVGSKGKYGSAAWHWRMQDCCNNLNDESKLTSPLGEAVALFINTDVTPPTECQLNAAAQQGIDSATAALQGASQQ